ncbi:putative C2H2 finger domain protein (Ezf) [Aspergillus brunneoviolaceus CBS 621.78]|uniref:Uncharacterized protein n=1 Tax=Aspergillus brunneoviolaceus CBS 621.78 TaxID=1450534 RepID=A0ACD1G6S3_9EURO|nr:hypothetical protein BO95DRAFT_166831 [Aspergillus brunneoviolaceus CBS 621.78]RAH44868.1 hypothetical protein BO95DRAFT_166831 [Aspergillus brunneoviolaceus CBS 621.78]
MNFTPFSYSSPSPFASSASDDHSILDATSAYASSMYATSFDMQNTQQLAGLGISHFGMESTASETELYAHPEPPTLSANAWSNTTFSSENFLQPPPEYRLYSSTTIFEPLSGVMEAAPSPASFYSSHTLSSSPSYGSSTETEGHREVAPDDGSSVWPRTPTSDCPNMPVDYAMKEDSHGLQGPPVHQGSASNASAATLSQMPPMPLSDTSTGLQWPPMDSRSNSAGLVSDQENALGRIPCEVISRWIEEVVRTPGEELKIPPASGLKCSVCGFRFTRRSNCREHEKRHDPKLRKSFPCAICGKTYGRNTDLRRHVQSAHVQERKHYCDQCGQYYSRQDTLNRHKLDGCPRKMRKCHAS